MTFESNSSSKVISKFDFHVRVQQSFLPQFICNYQLLHIFTVARVTFQEDVLLVKVIEKQ